MSVVAIGEIVVDWLSSAPGETLDSASNFYRALGGNATNVAIGLTRLGTSTRLVAKLGDDFHANFAVSALKKEGVEIDSLLTEVGAPTAQCYMTTTLNGEHQFKNWPRPNAADMLRTDDIDPSWFGSAAFLHATGISLIIDPRRTAIRRAVELAKESGVVFSFDGGFPTGSDNEARKCAEDFLASADLLKLNEAELLFWAGETRGATDLEGIAQRLYSKYRPVALLVTLAERGCFIVTEDGIVNGAPYPVKCVSGVGAGDGFIAGVLHELVETTNLSAPLKSLRDLSLNDWSRVARSGNIAGALATRHESAYAGMPTKQEFAAAVGKLRI